MHGLVTTLALLIFMVAWAALEQAPTCVSCSSKLRHAPDCPTRRLPPLPHEPGDVPWEDGDE